MLITSSTGRRAPTLSPLLSRLSMLRMTTLRRLSVRIFFSECPLSYTLTSANIATTGDDYYVDKFKEVLDDDTYGKNVKEVVFTIHT